MPNLEWKRAFSWHFPSHVHYGLMGTETWTNGSRMLWGVSDCVGQVPAVICFSAPLKCMALWGEGEFSTDWACISFSLWVPMPPMPWIPAEPLCCPLGGHAGNVSLLIVETRRWDNIRNNDRTAESWKPLNLPLTVQMYSHFKGIRS